MEVRAARQAVHRNGCDPRVTRHHRPRSNEAMHRRARCPASRSCCSPRANARTARRSPADGRRRIPRSPRRACRSFPSESAAPTRRCHARRSSCSRARCTVIVGEPFMVETNETVGRAHLRRRTTGSCDASGSHDQTDPGALTTERLAHAQREERAAGRRRGGAGSSTPHSSRAECIDSCGTPTSTVSIPRRVAVIGPIVEPHGMLLRDTKTCHGTPCASRMLAGTSLPSTPTSHTAGWR